jgi:type IX secretion system PorP/SprF family membrane protein
MKISYLFFIIISVALLDTGVCFAQQESLLSQYMFNGLVLNPAYAGSKDYAAVTAMFRKQWTGFPGSPVTQSVSIHGPLKNRNIGLGLMISNDHIGVTNQTDVYGSYAYHIQMNNAKLALGLQFGVSYVKSKLSDLTVWDSNDPVFELNTQTNLLPNFGAGIYYYREKFYAGISVPHLMNYDPDRTLGIEVKDAFRQTRHYYFSSGIVIAVGSDLNIKPSVLVKYVDGAPIQYDLNINFLLNNILWVGASYRSKDAIVAMVEYQINKKFRFGYSYDVTLSRLRSYETGSHEIMLGYDFGYNILKIKNPRYF